MTDSAIGIHALGFFIIETIFLVYSLYAEFISFIISNTFFVVFQLRMVMDLYSGDIMILLSRLLVRLELKRSE